MPKVSVIIPVYNTAPYLEESLSSIVNQTLRDIEIIIVDDGSSDGSSDVIEKFANNETRITCIKQENKGLSEARNIGLSKARGKYLYFMDSDDILDNDCFEKCYSKCEEFKLDFICFDALNFGTDRANILDYDRSGVLLEDCIYSGKELFEILLVNGQYRSPVWLNFVNLDFVKHWFSGFYKGILHEDHLFTVLLYLNTNRCEYINRKFFKRRLRHNSIMTSSFTYKNFEGYKITAEELIKKSLENPELSTLINIFIIQLLNAVIWQSYVLSLKNKIYIILWLIRINRINRIKLRNIIVLFFKRN